MSNIGAVHSREMQGLVLSEEQARSLSPASATLKAFLVTEEDMSNPPPRVPTFFEYVLRGVTTDQPEWLQPLAVLGKVLNISPSEGGVYVAHIAQHPDVTGVQEGQELQPVLSVVMDVAVTDLIINSGALHAPDHLLFGRTLGGVLCDAVIYVMQEG